MEQNPDSCPRRLPHPPLLPPAPCLLGSGQAVLLVVSRAGQVHPASRHLLAGALPSLDYSPLGSLPGRLLLILQTAGVTSDRGLSLNDHPAESVPGHSVSSPCGLPPWPHHKTLSSISSFTCFVPNSFYGTMSSVRALSPCLQNKHLACMVLGMCWLLFGTDCMGHSPEPFI